MIDKRWGVAVTALLLAAGTNTHAQTVAEVTVIGNRLPTYRGDALFSHIDIDKDGVARGASIDQTLKLDTQAALFRRSSSLTANPTVQGMGLRAIAPSGAGRALITLDGIPQNDPFGNWVIWAAIPPEALAHIHVVRGAGGGAYGGGALTGVVDMDLTPPKDAGFYSRADLGEAGNNRLSFGGAIGGLGLYYTDQTLHGDVPIRGTQRGTADIATYGRDHALLVNYQAKICPFDVCGQLDLLAGGYTSRRDTGLMGATATSTGDDESVSFTRAPTLDTNGFRLQLWHKNSGLSNTSVSVAAGRSSTTLANDQVATPATGDGFNAALRHQTAGVEWEIGIDARDTSGQSEEFYKYVSGLATRYRVAGGKTTLIGIYAEGTKTYGKLTLTGAVRADVWKSFDGHRDETSLPDGANVLHLTPGAQNWLIGSGRVALSYAVSDATSWRVAAYSGFRPPSLNELYRPFRVGNDVTEANADLKPEMLTGVELGVRHNRLIDADIFYNVVVDPVSNVTIGAGPATFPTAGFIPAGGTLRMRENVGEIAAYGFEAHGDVPLSAQLDLTSSLTLTHARYRKAYNNPQLDGLLPAEAPDYDATVGLNADLKPWTLAADISFEGETFDDDLNTLPLKPSTRLNVQADYAVTPHLGVTLRIDNALDNAIQIAHAGDSTLSYDNRRMATVSLMWRN